MEELPFRMTTQAFRPCPVCGSRQIERLHTQRFVLEDGHPLSDGYDVVDCAACGFVYADVSASQADYDAFYAELSKYDDAATSTGSGESPEDRDRLAETAEIVGGMFPSSEARILDIGCAGGGLLDALQRRGYRNLVGVDPSPTCARLTRERTGEAYDGWVTSLPSQIGTFDCVILSHVLEHVLDIASAIQALRRLLREGARVYLEVPDAVRYADHVYAPFQDFNTEHINHFSSRYPRLRRGRRRRAIAAFLALHVHSGGISCVPLDGRRRSCEPGPGAQARHTPLYPTLNGPAADHRRPHPGSAGVISGVNRLGNRPAHAQAAG
jgi:SAM-dependent methyltransferase